MILSATLGFVVLLALAVLGAGPEIIRFGLLLSLLAGYVLAGWRAYRVTGGKAALLVTDANPGGYRRLAPLGIGMADFGIVVVGIYFLEYRAESQARAFCDAAPVGGAITNVAEAAQGMGAGMLRKIEPNAVQVGFFGLPPYSRHFCSVEGKDGVVTAVRYFTLD